MALPAAALVLIVGIFFASRQVRSPSQYGPTSNERQVVCNAHGHLEMLAKYPGDPINAFELLKLDPREAPFYPPNKSYWRLDENYQEVHDKVTQHHMDMVKRARAGLQRRSPRELDYERALTMSASLLLQDGPRQYYLEVFLPMLEKEIEGKPRECVWPLVHAFHRRECVEVWATTGLGSLKARKAVTNKACA